MRLWRGNQPKPAEATPLGRPEDEVADIDRELLVARPPVVIGEPGRAHAEVVPRLPELAPGRPDTVIDDVSVGQIEVRAASARGLKHRYAGKTRQDEYCMTSAGLGAWLLVAVADGVSAGPASHVAAVAATRVACELMAATIEQGQTSFDWDSIVRSTADAVVRQGASYLRRANGGDSIPTAEDVRDAMSTTLSLLAVATEPDADGVHRGAGVALGDTSVWCLNEGIWRSVTPLKNDGAAVASNAVFALPSVPSDGVVGFEVALSRGAALFVMTDGVGDPLDLGTGHVGQILAEAWRGPPTALDFARQVTFARKSFDDDRTVVGMWPASERSAS